MEKTDKPYFFSLPLEAIPEDLVDLAYDEGKQYLESDLSSIAKTQQHVQTFLGWYLAAIVSLIGILVGLLSSAHPSTLALVMTAYGIVALSIPAFLLWKGALYHTTVYSSGAYPEHFLSKEILDWLEKFPVEKWVYYRKVQYLKDLQTMHEKNEELSKRIKKYYRSSIKCTAIGVIAGLILLLLLALLHP